MFDLEGTLVKHTTRQAKIVENAISSQKVKLFVNIEKLYYLRSDSKFHSAKDFIKEILRRNKNDFNDTLIDSMVKEYKRLRQNPKYLFNLQYLFKGTKTTLNILKKRGVKLVLLTNANPSQTNYLLKRFGLKKYFDLVIDDSCNLAEKPSPEKPKFILKSFGIKPSEALIVDDSVAGIEAGKKAKIKTCGVLTGNVVLKELKKSKADYTLDSVADLNKLF